jgi:LysR family hydrogen peroxide-inducible transcriptional activator
MNLRQLEYFVAIAEMGSLTQAAERLLVSQPSLSQQIRALCSSGFLVACG